MKIKVSEATGHVLNWMVAKADNAMAPAGDVVMMGKQLFVAYKGDFGEPGQWVLYRPTTDWGQGGPLIDLGRITVGTTETDMCTGWAMDEEGNKAFAGGPTMLIAAMRCFVISRLGDEVDVPGELLP